ERVPEPAEAVFCSMGHLCGSEARPDCADARVDFGTGIWKRVARISQDQCSDVADQRQSNWRPMPRHFCALVLLTATALALPPSTVSGQGERRELLAGSRVWVDGTSNKSDWSVKATELSGFVVLQLKQDQLDVS